MTEREYDLESAKASVRFAESKLSEAKRDLEHGVREAQAKYDREVLRLKAEVERRNSDLERARAFLKFKESEAERKFDA